MSLISAPALEKTRHLNKVPYLTSPFPTNTVRTRVRGNPNQDNITSGSGRGGRASYRTISLEISARGFCELLFRYLSSPTGREGEISRPLDHILFKNPLV